MALFDPPDLEKLKRNGDMARLIDWANYTKNPEVAGKALALLKRDPNSLVEYLYDTTVWTQQNAQQHGRRLPRRGVSMLKDATGILVRIRGRVIPPLVASVRDYEQYGDPDLKVRLLYFSLVFDVLERIGEPASDGLRDLARRSDEEDVRELAVEALGRLVDRGLIDHA
jgi:hypothetical protein